MIIETVDHADRMESDYYIIPYEIGKILKKAFGNDIYDPVNQMGEKLYDCYMSFCTHIGDCVVKEVDITFHLC